jgi:hypothetical protein
MIPILARNPHSAAKFRSPFKPEIPPAFLRTTYRRGFPVHLEKTELAGALPRAELHRALG